MASIRLAQPQAGKLNQNREKTQKLKTRKKILDPCFRNVWNREAKSGSRRSNDGWNNEHVLQLQAKQVEKSKHDGILLDVEGLEDELDYVNDVMDDDELSESEVLVENDQTEIQTVVNSNSNKKASGRLSGAMG